MKNLEADNDNSLSLPVLVNLSLLLDNNSCIHIIISERSEPRVRKERGGEHSERHEVERIPGESTS